MIYMPKKGKTKDKSSKVCGSRPGNKCYICQGPINKKNPSITIHSSCIEVHKSCMDRILKSEECIRHICPRRLAVRLDEEGVSGTTGGIDFLPALPKSKSKSRKKSKRGGTVDKRSKIEKRAPRRKIPRKNQDLEKNEGYYGPIMNEKGKLDRDEICRYCSPADYAKGARKFCKLHHKVWDSKTNSCKKSKRTKRR